MGQGKRPAVALLVALLFAAHAQAEDVDPPTVDSQIPAASSAVSSFTEVSVTFSEAVTGVVAGDLTVNGSPATSVTGSDEGPYTFTGYNPPSDGSTSIALAASNIKDLADNAFAGDSWTIILDGVVPTITTRSPQANATIASFTEITITFSESVFGIEAVDLKVNGSPATDITGSGAGPYTFTGYDVPSDGPVQVELSGFPPHIQDEAHNVFAGETWEFTVDTGAPVIDDKIPAANASVANLTKIEITFNEPVTGVAAGDLTVNGSPATNVSGSDAGPYEFTGFAAPPNGPANVSLAGGAITDAASNAFAGAAWTYAVDDGNAHVKNVFSDTPDGTYRTGQQIGIHVFFDKPINITGNPRLLLNVTTDPVGNRYATFTGPDDIDGMIFTYTAADGDSSADLDYANVNALELNGGTIKDTNNNNAILTLQAPGADGSLGNAGDIVIDAVKPAIVFNFNPINLTSSLATNIAWKATDNVTAPDKLVINLFIVQDGVPKPVAKPSLDKDTPKAVAIDGTTGDGTFTWYPSNRPGAAKFRVQAIDAVGNVAEMDSNEFTIQSPQNGQTTLRDFDMPGTQPLGISDQIRTVERCASCHGNSNAGFENIVKRWEGSMMANASIDPLFEACLKRANIDAPESGDLCLRCHIPKAWLNGRSTPTDGLLARQAADPIRALDKDKIGVACDVCHRFVDPKQTFPAPPLNPLQTVDKAILDGLAANKPAVYGNGMYVVDPEPSGGTYGTKRGPYNIAGQHGHSTYESPFFKRDQVSGVCGTCHDVSNPTLSATAFELNPAGDSLGITFEPNALNQPASDFDPGALMPIERTFSEWLNSSFSSSYIDNPAFPVKDAGNKTSTTCADCHMSDYPNGTARACRGGAPRADQARHELAGGNTWVPTRLAEMIIVPTPAPPGETEEQKNAREANDRAATLRKEALLASAERAKYMLENAAELESDVFQDIDGKQKLRVKVTNLTGHKLPTGYPEGRRMWLWVKVKDKFGQEYRSGYFGQGTTDDVVDDGNEIKSDLTIRGKPKLYESELLAPNGTADGRHFHFVLASEVHKDNRIPPRGFDDFNYQLIGARPVDPETGDWQTATQRYANGSYWDETIYDLPKCATRYEVKLYYQTASKAYITFLGLNYNFAQKGFGWALNGSPPELMEKIDEQQIPPLNPNAPQLLDAYSVRTHGTKGEFRIPIDLAPAPNSATTECRRDGAIDANELVFQFNQPVIASDVPNEPEITITSMPDGGVQTPIPGYGTSELRVAFASVPDMSCLTIKLHNIRGECNDLVMPDMEIKLRKLLGDTNNSGRVTSADVAQTKSVVTTPETEVDETSFRMDVTINGVLNLSDVIDVKGKSLNKVTCP